MCRYSPFIENRGLTNLFDSLLLIKKIYSLYRRLQTKIVLEHERKKHLFYIDSFRLYHRYNSLFSVNIFRILKSKLSFFTI